MALALLLGCDYLQGGVNRVGIVTAREIISEFSINDDDHALTILDRFGWVICHDDEFLRDGYSLFFIFAYILLITYLSIMVALTFCFLSNIFRSYFRGEIPSRANDSNTKKKLRRAKITLPDGFPNSDLFMWSAQNTWYHFISSKLNTFFSEAASVYLCPEVKEKKELPIPPPRNMAKVEVGILTLNTLVTHYVSSPSF